jgi:hypothetical protein
MASERASRRNEAVLATKYSAPCRMGETMSEAVTAVCLGLLMLLLKDEEPRDD